MELRGYLLGLYHRLHPVAGRRLLLAAAVVGAAVSLSGCSMVHVCNCDSPLSVAGKKEKTRNEKAVAAGEPANP